VLASYLTDLLSENDRDIRVTENLRLKKQMEERIALADVVTQNAEMLKILRLVEKINRSNLTVLLQGETGTGKTLIARAVHLSSPRAQGPFVTVDCAALPENLLESELFGYLKGSFTGAAIDKKGSSRRPMAARSSWTKSVARGSRCSAGSSTCSTRARCGRSAATATASWTCGSSAPPAARTCAMMWPRARSSRTSTSA
jgi:hypothetical protein